MRGSTQYAVMRIQGYIVMSSNSLECQHLERMNHMHQLIGTGMSMVEITQHLMEGCWMGPAEMMGAGGSPQITAIRRIRFLTEGN